MVCGGERKREFNLGASAIVALKVLNCGVAGKMRALISTSVVRPE